MFPALLIAVTGLGFAIRVIGLSQGLFGDELSTAWIVHGRSLGRVISLVYSDAEITPPLSFVLAWLSLKIGSSWVWLRLPSLLAGTATIPIVYGIGTRTAGRTAGLIAATIAALSAVMIMFSTEARNYSFMMAAVAGSTLSMLLALDTSRVRWWVLYGVCSCLAMYSHYSAAFVLIAQGAWLLWRQPDARRPAILANIGAAVAYAPWIPGWIKDTHSVTIPIVNALVPWSLGYVRTSVEQWAAGYPYLEIHQAPGITFAVLIGAGGVIALIGVLRRLIISSRVGPSAVRSLFTERIVLIFVLAGATLVGEAIYSTVGTHVLDSRNLNASLPALMVSIGILVTMAGTVLGAVSCALVIAGYGAGAADTLQTQYQRPDYPAVAQFISAHVRPGDEIIDASNITPVVPLTPLDAYLPQTHREFRLGLPAGPPPYTPFSKVTPSGVLLEQAVHGVGRGRIFLVTGSEPGGGGPGQAAQLLRAELGPGRVLTLLGPRYGVRLRRSFPGIETLTVSLIAPVAPSGAGSGSGSSP